MKRVPATPTFTIVIPTYNRGSLLARSINSVLAQTLDDFEVVLVDDGSEDDTRDVIRSFRDPRVSHVELRMNRGAATARNCGIRAARGRYIAFLDDDDEYLPEFLSTTHSVVKDAPERIGFLWSGVHFIKDRGPHADIRERQTWDVDSTNRRREHLNVCEALSIGLSYGVTMRRSALQRVGLFAARLRVAQDTELFLRLIANKYGFLSIPDVLVKHHEHSGKRLTDLANHHQRLQVTTEMIRRYGELLAENVALSAVLRTHARQLHALVRKVDIATRAAVIRGIPTSGQGPRDEAAASRHTSKRDGPHSSESAL